MLVVDASLAVELALDRIGETVDAGLRRYAVRAASIHSGLSQDRTQHPVITLDGLVAELRALR